MPEVHVHTEGIFNSGGTPGPLETALASLLTAITPALIAALPLLLAAFGLKLPPATPAA